MNPAAVGPPGPNHTAAGGGGGRETSTTTNTTNSSLKRTGSIHSTASISSLHHASKSSSMESLESSMSTTDCPPGRDTLCLCLGHVHSCPNLHHIVNVHVQSTLGLLFQVFGITCSLYICLYF